MDIAVLSGKGGAGKTTFSLNLAVASMGAAALLDCDVEEPNSRLFLDPVMEEPVSVEVIAPVVNEELCSHCGKCGEFCTFNAILVTPKLTIVMPEMCHHCTGCSQVCPSGAISYTKREVGKTFYGRDSRVSEFMEGVLNIGEFSAVKVIDAVKQLPVEAKHRIIDAPPGSACAAVQAVEGADLAIIVVEPTPFSLSDSSMVIEMVESLKIPFIVVINKIEEDSLDVRDLFKKQEIPVLGSIPFNLDYARTIANGKLLASLYPEEERRFKEMWQSIININSTEKTKKGREVL